MYVDVLCDSEKNKMSLISICKWHIFGLRILIHVVIELGFYLSYQIWYEVLNV